MGTGLITLLVLVLLAWPWTSVEAQNVGQVFRQVNPSVVVIRTKEKDVTALSQGQGQVVSVSGVGSGVLISPDGKVMTAAHVVHTADEISVEFLSGEAVGARVVASEPQADVSLLQLERVPSGALVAKLGDAQHRVRRHVAGGVLSDGRGHQPGELRRAHVQHGRRGDRGRQPHHLEVGGV